MGTFKKVLAAGLAVAFFAGTASAQLLWDNNIEPDGFSGRAVSPPNFPDIRVADDFVVPQGLRWVIRDAHFDLVEDAAWTDAG